MNKSTRRFTYCIVGWLIGIGLYVAPVSGSIERLFEVVAIALIFFSLGFFMGMPGPQKQDATARESPAA